MCEGYMDAREARCLEDAQGAQDVEEMKKTSQVEEDKGKKPSPET